MNKYVMNEESRTNFLSIDEQIRELINTHSTLKSECEEAMEKAENAESYANEAASYAESANEKASAADDSCDNAESQLEKIKDLFSRVTIAPHEEESEVDKLVKLTGKSVDELKHILRYE